MGFTSSKVSWRIFVVYPLNCGHPMWILRLNDYRSLLFDWQNFICLRLLGTINPMVDYFIPIVAICYLKMNSIIGSDQLDETSSILSRSIDIIPIVVFWYRLWSSYVCYDFIYHLPLFKVYFARKPLADTMIIVS